MKHAYYVVMHKRSGWIAYAIRISWDWVFIEEFCESHSHGSLHKDWVILDKGIQTKRAKAQKRTSK